MDFTFRTYNRIQLETIKDSTFIYGIVRNSEYLYIGKTIKGTKRILSHRFLEDTDEFHIWIPNEYLGLLEVKLIKLFKPKFNVRHINLEKKGNKNMSGKGSKRHIHKYHKLSDGLWHCALSDCTHYMPSNVAACLPGKRSICWECGNEMILDDDNMKLEQPLCIICLNPQLDELSKFLASKGI